MASKQNQAPATAQPTTTAQQAPATNTAQPTTTTAQQAPATPLPVIVQPTTATHGTTYYLAVPQPAGNPPLLYAWRLPAWATAGTVCVYGGAKAWLGANGVPLLCAAYVTAGQPGTVTVQRHAKGVVVNYWPGLVFAALPVAGTAQATPAPTAQPAQGKA